MTIEMTYLKTRRGLGVTPTQASFKLHGKAQQAIWQEAKGRAWAQGVTVSSLVIEALAEYLAKHSRQVPINTPPGATR